jgi:hypothetical protein
MAAPPKIAVYQPGFISIRVGITARENAAADARTIVAREPNSARTATHVRPTV